jgi:5'/3'-nucleotidase SurE
MKPTTALPLIAHFLLSVQGLNILQSNDDGWAETNIRTLFNTLTTTGSHNVILSAPADNRSGSSSLDIPPLPRLTPCEFDSCPANSPSIGRSPSNPRLQYVNSFPVTALKTGFRDLASQFLDGRVDLVVTGPNVGSNLDIQVPFSGTVGAAVEAVKRGVPAIAFSGKTGDPIAFDAPDQPAYPTIYAELALLLVSALTADSGPYLPENAWLNVNFPDVDVDVGKCTDVGEFQFILSRINPGLFSGEDVEVCGNGGRLPRERTVVDREDGCFVSVSVGDAEDKTTADRAAQEVVAERLRGFLGCLP